jgi:ABC-type proline/glycine betaine transport system permease subunit
MRRFLKDHLLDVEVIAALGVGALLRYGLDTSWTVAILLGLSVFVLIPILIWFGFHVRALFLTRHFKD